MDNLERCTERCPLVTGLPDTEKARILGAQALHLCPDALAMGQIGPLCGLPAGTAKDVATREAIDTAKQLARITV